MYRYPIKEEYKTYLKVLLKQINMFILRRVIPVGEEVGDGLYRRDYWVQDIPGKSNIICSLATEFADYEIRS